MRCVSTGEKDDVVRCEMEPKTRKKCRRCRLLKCFQCGRKSNFEEFRWKLFVRIFSGMEKERIRIYEENLLRKQYAEQYRQLRHEHEAQCQALAKSIQVNSLFRSISKFKSNF